MWGGAYFYGSTTPYRKGAGHKRSPIFGVPFYLCTHPLKDTTKFDVVTHIGDGLF